MSRLTIAIVGAESKMGSAIACKLALLKRYRLLLLSEEESGCSQLSDRIREDSPDTGPEAEVIRCLKDGCWEADIIILDVPSSSAVEVAKKIQEVSTQKIVFDISSNEDGIDSAFTRAVKWQELLPNAKVVSVVNKLAAAETVLTGSTEESITIVADIISSIGFKP